MKENSPAVFAVTKTTLLQVRNGRIFRGILNLGKHEKEQYDYRCPKEHYSTRCAPKKINRSVLSCHGRPPVQAPVGLLASNSSAALTPVDARGYLTFDKLHNSFFLD